MSAKPLALFEQSGSGNSRDEFDFKEEFGSIPSSVRTFSKSKKLLSYLDEGNTKDVEAPGQKAKAALSGTNLRYSIYIPDQAVWIMKYYIQKSNSLIIDPFMGRGTRSQMSLLLGHRYVGYDTCPYTVKLNQKLSDRNNFSKDNYKYILGSGTVMEEYKDDSDIFDACFTCPPYFNAEKYSGENGDISVLSDTEFLQEIYNMFKQLYRLMKVSDYEKGIFHPVIITVGSKRVGKNGLLDMDYSFQQSAKLRGFTLHDKLITVNKTPIGAFTFRRNYKKHFLQKAHETTLVFLKY